LPGVKAGCILVFAISLGFYITPAALGGTRDMMLANVIAKLVDNLMDFGYASAISIVLLAMTIAVYVISGGGIGGLVTGETRKERRPRNMGSFLAAAARAAGNSELMTRFQRQLWERSVGRAASRAA